MVRPLNESDEDENNRGIYGNSIEGTASDGLVAEDGAELAELERQAAAGEYPQGFPPGVHPKGFPEAGNPYFSMVALMCKVFPVRIWPGTYVHVHTLRI